MVNSLRKVDFSHPTGHYTWNKIRPPSLKKSWVRPWLSAIDFTICATRIHFLVRTSHNNKVLEPPLCKLATSNLQSNLPKTFEKS